MAFIPRSICCIRACILPVLVVVLAVLASPAAAAPPTAADLDGLQFEQTSTQIDNDASVGVCTGSYRWISQNDKVTPYQSSAMGWSATNDSAPTRLHGPAPQMLFIVSGGSYAFSGIDSFVGVRNASGELWSIRVSGPGPDGRCVNPRALAIGESYTASATWSLDTPDIPDVSGPASIYVQRVSQNAYLETVTIGTGPAPAPGAIPAPNAPVSVPNPTPTPDRVQHIRVVLKAWIAQSYVLDPERVANIPYLFNVEGDCLKPPLLDRPRATVSSRYRGDGHAGFAGTSRVEPSVEFDWDGQQISNFRATPVYAMTHRDLLYHWGKTTRNCNIQAKQSTGTTTGILTGPTGFRLSVASKNPVPQPQFATPAIDEGVTGRMLPDGRLALDYEADLFPAAGIQVSRNGVVSTEATINDTSCLSDGFVQSLAGAAAIAWGLTHHDNKGSLTVANTPSTFGLGVPSPLCTLTQSVVIVNGPGAEFGGGSSGGGGAGGGWNARAAIAAPSQTITVSAPNTPSMSLSRAVQRGLVQDFVSRDGLAIVSDSSRRVVVRTHGRGVVVRVGRITSGRVSALRLYGPTTDSLAVDLAARTATVGGRRVRSRTEDRRAPRTRARVIRAGGTARIVLHASDRSGVRRTYYRLTGRRQVYRRALRVPVNQLPRLRFSSIDALGNVESLRRLR